MGLYLEEACKFEWRSVEAREKRKLASLFVAIIIFEIVH
jgi:hypothetical protein